MNGPPHAIAHRTAETASLKHLISHDQAPFLIGIGQRYIDRLDPVKKRGRSLFATIRGQTGLGVVHRSFLTLGLRHALKFVAVIDTSANFVESPSSVHHRLCE